MLWAGNFLREYSIIFIFSQYLVLFSTMCICYMLYSALSRVRLCNSMGCSPPGSSVHEFSRQEYWSRLPFFSSRRSSWPRQGSNLLLLNLLSWQEDSLWLSRLGSPCLIILYINECVCVVLPAQSYLILCDPIDYRPPGSSVHGILQATILEWVAIPFFRWSSWPTIWTQVSCIAGRHFNI